ncbi:MAG: aminoglycoside phosphotransferase [Rhodobacteraceae bacterium PARR1]|nr:MAG: aminoglycoside phosphotransferase [Rhodobacteraceae bacterium PARR1]
MTQPLTPSVPPDILHDLRRQDAGWAEAGAALLSGGRTNHVWRVGNRVLKHYRPHAATPLFPNDPGAEVRALRLFAPEGLAPELRAVSGEWLLIDHIPGAVWGHSADEDPAPVAQALGRLHRQRADEGFRALPNGTAALRADALRVAGTLPMPPLPDVPDMPPLPPCPVHADAVPGNIIAAPQGPVLIDWQCPGLGDPAEDLATFLSPAMQWLYTGRTLSPDQRERFLSAYPGHAAVDRLQALEPLYAWRIAAHCRHRAAKGDTDYAQALQQMA